VGAGRIFGDLELDRVVAAGFGAQLFEHDGEVVRLEPEPNVRVGSAQQDPAPLDVAALDRPQPHLEVLGGDLVGQPAQRAAPDRGHVNSLQPSDMTKQTGGEQTPTKTCSGQAIIRVSTLLARLRDAPWLTRS
jgi:hypothetical protein